ncbi:DPP IV N-terminal domain-containing protein [uncultured Bacteroides sp.]|uniref:S9 family peptidase n=1 Tax=uncultured Bacteroides sp. TaxID=162156 RepID=UPI002AA6AE9D|nr:DPP IV N-terminal domain-containing protein [uncultured Bacteroides sp.]
MKTRKGTGKNIGLFFILPFLFISNIMAQETKLPTLEDLIPGGETFRVAENLFGIQWQGDVCIKPEIDKLLAVNPLNGKENILISREETNKILEADSLGKIQQFYNVSFPYELSKQTPNRLMLVTTPKYRVLLNIDQRRVEWSQPRKEKAQNEDWEKESKALAFTVDNNLYVTTADGITTTVTNEPEGIVCGQSVHRNEFGITKGTFWSPKGNLLAFYRMDESMVSQYPLVDITARVGTVNYVRYPMAGMTSHKVTIGIYNLVSKKTRYLKIGDPTDRYFTNISWAPNGKSIYLIELNRDQNDAKLCQYDVESGELVATLFEETHPKYVEPQHPIAFLPWDDSKFIYQSQCDGFNHLYLYSVNGKLIKQLTSGQWLVKELIGFDLAKKELIISSTEISPLQSNLFRVNMKNGKRTAIGSQEGIHSALLSSSGKYVIDKYTSPTVPRNIDIVNTRTNKSIHVLTAKDPFAGYTMPKIETGTIKAADGTTDLYYRITKPYNFDPNKKYPVIVYVYGGPHAQMVTNGWQNGARGWDIYMANKGYIMFTLDNRGSENRGLEFENCTFRHLGIKEGQDQIKGIDFLKSLPYIDGNRIGVHGWSFGGHMTIALMLRYPDIYKVGVAGGPVIDWAYYEVMYGERYMDTPQTNPEGYKECNLKNLAGKLKGHLLIIHDDHDDTCVPQHTFSFLKACIDARTYPDLFVYPGHKHNVAGRDRVHLHEKITRYFEDYL